MLIEIINCIKEGDFSLIGNAQLDLLDIGLVFILLWVMVALYCADELKEMMKK